jgi:hypothetical protein
MTLGLNEGSSRFLRRVATALVTCATAAAPLAYAWPSERPFIVRPADLPEPARQPGEAMFLQDFADGRTLLYVEQNQGARLAVFDVTNPAHIKRHGSVQLAVPGPFDFVSAFGKRMEVVRFRQGQGEAVLDLNRADVPTLKSIERLMLQGTTTSVNANETFDGRQIDAGAQPPPGFQTGEAESPEEFKGVLDASQIREQVTKTATGTTFLLTESGLYVIRRPIAEREKERREWERHLLYDGG